MSCWRMLLSREPELRRCRFQLKVPTRALCPDIARTCRSLDASHSWMVLWFVPTARKLPPSLSIHSTLHQERRSSHARQEVNRGSGGSLASAPAQSSAVTVKPCNMNLQEPVTHQCTTETGFPRSIFHSFDLRSRLFSALNGKKEYLGPLFWHFRCIGSNLHNFQENGTSE